MIVKEDLLKFGDFSLRLKLQITIFNNTTQEIATAGYMGK
jgi:hypothetical protein